MLVLNPDLVLEPGAIRALVWRVSHSDAGIVVPQLLDDNGIVYTSSAATDAPSALGDALLGATPEPSSVAVRNRLRGRPKPAPNPVGNRGCTADPE